jgi:hypothetical protein
MKDTVEIAVPSNSAGSVVALLFGWGLALFAVLGADASELPTWAAPAVLGASPLVLAAAVWPIFARRVVVASRSGVGVTRRPLPTWTVWIPRDHLAFVAIEEQVHEDDDTIRIGRADRRSGGLFGTGPTRWAVVAETRGRRQHTLAQFGEASTAKAAAEAVRRAVGI